MGEKIIHDDEPMMSMDDAVNQIMKSTGKNRRQAQAMLIEACRRGDVRSVRILDGSDEPVPIPPAAWPKIN